jgi:hypothetical protein
MLRIIKENKLYLAAWACLIVAAVARGAGWGWLSIGLAVAAMYLGAEWAEVPGTCAFARRERERRILEKWTDNSPRDI